MCIIWFKNVPFNACNNWRARVTRWRWANTHGTSAHASDCTSVRNYVVSIELVHVMLRDIDLIGLLAATGGRFSKDHAHTHTQRCAKKVHIWLERYRVRDREREGSGTDRGNATTWKYGFCYMAYIVYRYIVWLKERMHCCPIECPNS